MKYSALGLSFLLFVVACNSTEKVNLPASEREALRQRVLSECVDKAQGSITKFKAVSADVFGSSGDWVRNKGYQHKYTKTGNTSPDTTTTIRVWKSTVDNLYLFITTATSDTTKRYFLRLPKASGQVGGNEDLINDLFLEGCLPLESEDDESYTTITGSSDGPAVAKKQYIEAYPEDTTMTIKKVETYTFNFRYPAWAGNWHKQVNITYRDRNGRPVSTPAAEEYKSTFTVLTGQTDLITDSTNSFYYNNPTSDPTARFCEVVVPTTDTTYPDYPITYKLPFEIPADIKTSCDANFTAAGWTDFAI